MISTNYGKTKALLLLIMALLVSSLSLRAEKPLKPLYFLVDYSAYDKLMICETSLDGDYENVDGFRVYINYPWQSDPSFSLLADVVRNDSLMKHFESFYAFMIWNDLKQGDYKLLLTAYNSDGESVPSDTFYLKVGNPDEPSDYVVIYSDSLNPADYTAYLGVEYKSKLSAYAESGREVNFRTEYAPEGFQIDPITGEFSWTPTESGDFDINIRAFVKEEPEIYADWWWRVHVNKCSEKTIIKGKVIDKETGAPIEYGFVTLMQSGKDSIDFYYGKYWGEIINGEFSIEVDEGTFYIMAQGDFEPVWYENAKDYSEATPITLKCGETAEIKFIVEKFKTYPIHTVTGKVTDRTAILSNMLMSNSTQSMTAASMV